MDYTKLNDINYYINYSIGDTEGVGFEGSEKYRGTTVVYFPTKEEIDLYAALPAIGDRKKLYGNMVMDYEKGDVLKLDIRNWDGSLVKDDDMKDKTVIILYNRITNGKTINYTAEQFRRMGVSEVYAYTSLIDIDVLDKNTDEFMSMLDSGIVGELYTKDISLYNKHKRITLIDAPFYDYF